jgi:hypothetical protein
MRWWRRKSHFEKLCDRLRWDQLIEEYVSKQKPSASGRETAAAIDVDVRLLCHQCGQHFWWPVEYQRMAADGKSAKPTVCDHCLARGGSLARTTGSHAVSFPQTQQPLITEDIRKLIAESSVEIRNRYRTPVEWWRGEDVFEKQLAKKVRAGQAANTLVKQRVELINTVIEAAKRADDFRRERLEAQLAELELQGKIADRLRLRDAPVSERERLIQEQREDLRARASVRRQTLEDLDKAVNEIFESKLTDWQMAAQIRAVLEVYQQDESILSESVRAFLRCIDDEE